MVLVPQALAYAYLAGVPPVYGLYASLLPMLIYGFLGTSPQMNVGPVAITAVLILAGISTMADPFTNEYVQLVIFCGLIVGIMQVVMGLLRMGFIVNFLSHPVLSGFISAAAVIIIVSQLPNLLGIESSSSSTTVGKCIDVCQDLISCHHLSLMIGGISLVVLLVLKKLAPRFPGLLLVISCTTLLSYFINAPAQGVDVIGDIPSGLPAFSLMFWDISSIVSILPTALTVCFVGFIGSLSISKGLEIKHRSYKIDANKELIALGAAKIAGSFFQAMPSSGSFSRSALNDTSGAHSGFSSIISSLIVGLTLLILTPIFYYIPTTVLAAAIIYSVFGLLNISEFKYLYKIRRRDLLMMILTFAVTLGLGIEIGILTGVVLSLLLLLYQTSRPNVVELGAISHPSGMTHYRNVDRFKDAATTDNHLIIRFDNQLHFANSSYFKDSIITILDEKPTKPSFLVLDASNIYDMDSTGLHALEDLYVTLKGRSIQLVISGAKGDVRDLFKRSGFFQKLETTHHFMQVTDAIAYSESDDLDNWNPAAIQSDF